MDVDTGRSVLVISYDIPIHVIYVFRTVVGTCRDDRVAMHFGGGGTV